MLMILYNGDEEDDADDGDDDEHGNQGARLSNLCKCLTNP